MRQPHCRFVFVCACRLNLYHKTTTAGTYHNVYFLKQIGTASLVICQDTTCQGTSREATLPDRLEDRQLQPSLHEVRQCGCFRLTPHHKTSRPLLARSCSRVWSSTWPSTRRSSWLRSSTSRRSSWVWSRTRPSTRRSPWSQDSDGKADPMSQPNSTEETRSQFHPTGRKEKQSRWP